MYNERKFNIVSAPFEIIEGEFYFEEGWLIRLFLFDIEKKAETIDIVPKTMFQEGGGCQMRIVAGSRRGIPLKSLPGNDTRPTSDKVKESVFNMIGPYFDGGIVVELFGGSGALSLEALSRGADKAIIFEKNSKACAIIQANAEKSKFTDQIHIERTDARNAVNILKKMGKKLTSYLLTHPMRKQNFMNLRKQLLKQGVCLIMRLLYVNMRKKCCYRIRTVHFQKIKCTVYGNSAISIYEK